MALINLLALTTVNRARLYQGQPGTTAATLYTVPASTDVKVNTIVLTNTGSATATVTLSIVPSGQSDGVTRRILHAFQVLSTDTVIIDGPHHMTAGDFISASQGTSGSITVTINGETYA